MSGYTIGLIAEGVVALILIIAIAVIVAKRRKEASRDRVVNGIGGYLVHFPDDEEDETALERPGIQSYSDPGQYGRTEHFREEYVWDVGTAAKPEEYRDFRRVVEDDLREKQTAGENQWTGYEQTEKTGWNGYESARSTEWTGYGGHALTGQWPGHEPQAEEAEGEGVVRFQTAEKTFADAYAELSVEQKRFFSDILRYALSKPKAEQKMSKTGICVKSSGKVILKLKVRRKMTVALFRLENERLRDYRRHAGNTSAIRQKETEIYVSDESSKDTACGMVDLMLEQYAREKQEAKERRRALRAAKRAEQAALRDQAAASSETSGEDSQSSGPVS